MSNASIEGRSAVTSLARRFVFPTESKFLSQAVLLEEAGPPRVPALACLLGFLFVAIALVAGALIQVDIVTSSPGRIVAANGNHVLQSFDGGIIDQVQVEEGQVVEAGDLLLLLKDPEAEAQSNRLVIREATLAAKMQRLQSLAEITLDTSNLRNAEAKFAANEQMSILPIEQQAMIAERSLVQAEIDRRSKVVRNLSLLEGEALQRVALVTDQLETERHLFEKRLSTKNRLLEAQRNTVDATVRLKEMQGQIREAEAGLLEARQRLENVVADRKLQQGNELSTLLLDLNETRQQIKAMQQRLERAEIRAPVRGVILEIKARHTGQTIAPGDPILEIIPIDNGLEGEIRLPPSEISYIHPGQPVRIAIDGIEPHRHGYLDATVGAISPSTFIDENAMAYYRAEVTLLSDSIGDIPLTPGMTMQAQIKTGSRTMLEYLLKPVYRAWDTAFRER